jgi:hypothetical protein
MRNCPLTEDHLPIGNTRWFITNGHQHSTPERCWEDLCKQRQTAVPSSVFHPRGHQQTEVGPASMPMGSTMGTGATAWLQGWRTHSKSTSNSKCSPLKSGRAWLPFCPRRFPFCHEKQCPARQARLGRWGRSRPWTSDLLRPLTGPQDVGDWGTQHLRLEDGPGCSAPKIT